VRRGPRSQTRREDAVWHRAAVKPALAKPVDAGTKTNTIDRRRRDDQNQHDHDNDAFHYCSLPFLGTATTIRSYPSYLGRRLSLPPARSTAFRRSPQTVQKVSATAGVAGTKLKSLPPSTNSAAVASTPPIVPHRQTCLTTRLRLSRGRPCRICVAGPALQRADRARPWASAMIMAAVPRGWW
jgi:hypothetical protein